jgi:L-aspartate oxidase
VSCTGVHGANRLASNSLLEGLVFGRLAALAVPSTFTIDPHLPSGDRRPVGVEADADALAIRQRVREIMRDDVSVVRSAKSLADAVAALDRLAGNPALDANTLDAITTRSMTLLAREIAVSALNRRESRGGHYRADAPETDDSLDGQHQLVTRQPDGTFDRAFGPLDAAWTESPVANAST